MDLVNYIKAGYSILYLHTPEGDRAEAEVVEACGKLGRKLRTWSMTEGLRDGDGESNHEQIEDPIEAVSRMTAEDKGTVAMMKNFHLFMSSGKSIQQLKDVARDFKQTQKTMIIVSPVKKIPPELERDITVLELDLPGHDFMGKVLDSLYTEGAEKKLGKLSDDERERIVQAAMGLTAIEAENAMSKALVQCSANNEGRKKNAPLVGDTISRLVMKEKALTVKKSGILEYFEAKQGASDVGGLENLKEWLATRAKAFSKAARDFGLPMPRGMLLVGLPGCGKSLSAKAASNIWGVPLLRFDIGKVFAGLVGQSEENMRKAIQTAEAVGNCVLWIDEMEKAFAGMGSGGSSDGGTSQRVFGNFITWMQEKTAPVFIIATVNRIESLPPELLRKGRFDEMFFVGLPSEKERKTIFDIHLKRYGKRTFSDAEIADCAKNSEGFSGAEIEEAVVSGLYAAFNHERQLEVEDVLKAIKTTNPLSKSKKDELEKMAEWAEKNAINASRVEPKDKTAVRSGRQLEL